MLSALTPVPENQSCMWSHVALAADMALDNFLNLITAAPRCWTVCNRAKHQLSYNHHISHIINKSALCSLNWVFASHQLMMIMPIILHFPSLLLKAVTNVVQHEAVK